MIRHIQEAKINGLCLIKGTLVTARVLFRNNDEFYYFSFF